MTWDRLLKREYSTVKLLHAGSFIFLHVMSFVCTSMLIVFLSEEFCEIFRAKDRNTLKMYTCKKFLKKDGRKVRKAAKNEITILKM